MRDTSSSGPGEGMYTGQMYATTTPSASQQEAARDMMRESNAVPESTSRITASGEEVIFPLHNSPVPGVGYTGRLIEDDAGCIRLIVSDSTGDALMSGTAPTVLWPGFGYSARLGEDGEVVIVAEDYEGGQVRAREGDEVDARAGAISRAGNSSRRTRAWANEPSASCSGAAPDVITSPEAWM